MAGGLSGCLSRPGCAQNPPNIKMEPPKSNFNIRGRGLLILGGRDYYNSFVRVLLFFTLVGFTTSRQNPKLRMSPQLHDLLEIQGCPARVCPVRRLHSFCQGLQHKTPHLQTGAARGIACTFQNYHYYFDVRQDTLSLAIRRVRLSTAVCPPVRRASASANSIMSTAV